MGLGGDAGESPEYAIIAKVKNGGNSGTMYVYRTRAPFDPNAIGPALGGSAAQAAGQTYYQLPGKNGPLNQAAVYAPSDRVIVVVANGPQQTDLVQKSIAGKQNTEGSFWGRMGRTGEQVTKGHVWALIRAEGDLSDYISEMVKPIATDFKSLADQGSKSPLFGIWTSFGAKVTFGAAIQCDSPESASAVVDSVRNSTLGSGDETEELPNSIKNAYSQLRSKEMSEFRSNLKFYSTGDCAYLRSQMTSKDKAQQALQTFANPNIADGGASGGGFGPPGGMMMPGGFGPPGG
jgi:hypothetical protein